MFYRHIYFVYHYINSRNDVLLFYKFFNDILLFYINEKGKKICK